jgi:hypothetical protein
MTEHLAEGQAALWLSESLILALINAGIVEKDRILEAVDVVIAAKRAMAISGQEPEIATASIALLRRSARASRLRRGVRAKHPKCPGRGGARRATHPDRHNVNFGRRVQTAGNYRVFRFT